MSPMTELLTAILGGLFTSVVALFVSIIQSDDFKQLQ